jgi:hypothetical protein
MSASPSGHSNTASQQDAASSPLPLSERLSQEIAQQDTEFLPLLTTLVHLEFGPANRKTAHVGASTTISVSKALDFEDVVELFKIAFGDVKRKLEATSAPIPQHAEFNEVYFRDKYQSLKFVDPSFWDTLMKQPRLQPRIFVKWKEQIVSVTIKIFDQVCTESGVLTLFENRVLATVEKELNFDTSSVPELRSIAVAEYEIRSPHCLQRLVCL